MSSSEGVAHAVGTSGFSYKEWKPAFYPQDLPQKKMLSFYAERFRAVEINNTFYRMPKPEILEKWCQEVPEDFCFVLKVPRRITHLKKLEDIEDDLAYFLQVSEALGPKRGPFFAQFPPRFAKDLDRLISFLSCLKDQIAVALEFRHPSWNHPEIHAVMQEHNVAWVVSDQLDEESIDEEDDDTPWAAPRELPEHTLTADWTYLRLRRCRYSSEELQAWAKRMSNEALDRSYVFFKHEDDATGPELAANFSTMLANVRRSSR